MFQLYKQTQLIKLPNTTINIVIYLVQTKCRHKLEASNIQLFIKQQITYVTFSITRPGFYMSAVQVFQKHCPLWKTLWEKEKLLVTSNFSFSHSVFKRPVLQTRKNGVYSQCTAHLNSNTCT